MKTGRQTTDLAFLNALLISSSCFLQHKTIESVLERGEKLDSLVDKSAALSQSSKTFYKTAKKQVRNATVPCSSAEGLADTHPVFLNNRTAAVWSCKAAQPPSTLPPVISDRVTPFATPPPASAGEPT